MFIKIFDTLVNTQHISRVNPPAELFNDGSAQYVVDMEVSSGNSFEGRRYKFIDMQEAQEFFRKIEEAVCPTLI